MQVGGVMYFLSRVPPDPLALFYIQVTHKLLGAVLNHCVPLKVKQCSNSKYSCKIAPKVKCHVQTYSAY